MKLYVVRHGETVENSNNCLCGRINCGLTEKGIDQAKEVAKYFEDKIIDVIVSSPLDRCIQTAEIIADGKVGVIYSDSLLGRDHGEFTGVHKSMINFDEYWDYNKNVQYQSAESVRALYDRVAKLIEELKNSYGDKNIIIVTHSGILRVLYYYFAGIPENGILSEIEIKNCEVFEYNI